MWLKWYSTCLSVRTCLQIPILQKRNECGLDVEMHVCLSAQETEEGELRAWDSLSYLTNPLTTKKMLQWKKIHAADNLTQSLRNINCLSLTLLAHKYIHSKIQSRKYTDHNHKNMKHINSNLFSKVSLYKFTQRKTFHQFNLSIGIFYTDQAWM
jgi:hypothetical protein